MASIVVKLAYDNMKMKMSITYQWPAQSILYTALKPRYPRALTPSHRLCFPSSLQSPYLIAETATAPEPPGL
jgi:hypothetical protein